LFSSIKTAIFVTLKHLQTNTPTMQSPPIRQPFTNLQLELIDLFSLQLPDSQLQELRRIISLYLLEQAREEADGAMREKRINAEYIQELIFKQEQE